MSDKELKRVGPVLYALGKQVKEYSSDNDPKKAKQRLWFGLGHTSHAFVEIQVIALRNKIKNKKEYEFAGKTADLANHIVHWALLPLELIAFLAVQVAVVVLI